MFVPIQDVIDEIRNLPVSEPAPPEREPIPEGVYYSTSVDNFCDIDKLGLGNDFWMKWISRRDEFPKSADEAKVRAVENKESKT
jgi:hypothetical protein